MTRPPLPASFLRVTPLGLAALRGGPQVLSALLAAAPPVEGSVGGGIDAPCLLPQPVNHHGFTPPKTQVSLVPECVTPLGAAALGPNPPALRILLAAGAAVNLGGTLLGSGCSSPLVASLALPPSKYWEGGYDEDGKKEEETVIPWQDRTAHILLAAGAAPGDSGTDDFGRQPLHLAFLARDVGAVNALLAAGAAVDAPMPLLELARRLVRPKCTGKAPYVRWGGVWWRGVTCLWAAAAEAWQGHKWGPPLVQALLEGGASLGACDASAGLSVLGAAVTAGVPPAACHKLDTHFDASAKLADTVRLLLSQPGAGEALRKGDAQGWTPHHLLLHRVGCCHLKTDGPILYKYRRKVLVPLLDELTLSPFPPLYAPGTRAPSTLGGVTLSKPAQRALLWQMGRKEEEELDEDEEEQTEDEDEENEGEGEGEDEGEDEDEDETGEE